VIVVSFGAAWGTLWCIRGPTAHFRSLWRLSHSCRARGPKCLLPSLSLLLNGTMSKWLFKWGQRSEALTFVFYSAFIKMWQLWIAISRIIVYSLFLSGFWGDATREQPCLSRFLFTIVRNVLKLAQSSRQYLKMHASWHAYKIYKATRLDSWLYKMDKKETSQEDYKRLFSTVYWIWINNIFYLWRYWMK